jgi:hypothetical protein
MSAMSRFWLAADFLRLWRKYSEADTSRKVAIQNLD